MRFQITIKEQAEAINGKAKYPLYKSRNEKNCDEDKGLETLQQLIQSSSIKVFCNQCQKEITLETIVVAYEGQEVIPNQKENEKKQQIKPPLQQQLKHPFTAEKQDQQAAQQSMSRLEISKLQKRKESEDQIFEDNSQQNPQDASSDQQSQKQNQSQLERLQRKSEERANKEKSNEKSQPIKQVTYLYCVGCFACLEEFPKFYSIRKGLGFSPQNSKWRLFDEICLLNGLKIWGFGNWGQIKEFMDFNSCLFTTKQIEDHYEQIYLNQDGPSFPKFQDFDITKTQKPAKKQLEEIMHNYYFPPESQDKIAFQSQFQLESNFKRQRPFQIEQKSVQEKKNDLLQKAFIIQKPFLSGHSSKHLKNQVSGFNNGNFGSKTSLFNENGQVDKKMKEKNKNESDENSESQEQSDSEQSEQNQDNRKQIQLKPKSSNMMHENRVNGKGLKQALVRQSHQHLEEANFPHKNMTSSTHLQDTVVNPSFCSNNKLKGHNVYSYNPKRKEFQIIEYDYYAESMLAQLEFTEEDSEEQIELKLKIIEEYNRRLDQRIKRREFVIQHRLLDTEFLVKTAQKYNKHYVQKFQPFRRLLKRNEEYYRTVQAYDKMNKAKSLAQGMIKMKKKLGSFKKQLNFKDLIEYLNKKKQKKELLGQRARFENESERKVLYKQASKTNKKVILSMSQNSYSYVNTSPKNQTAYQSSQEQAIRTMTSRSQQRQRLRSINQCSGRESQSTNKQDYVCENINIQNIGTNNSSGGAMSSSSIGLGSILSQEDISVIEKMLKKETQVSESGVVEFKPIMLKNSILKSLPIQAYQN